MSALVLASRSAVRLKLMTDAGLRFEADAADLDEEALVAGIADPAQQAALLAEHKARHVAARHPGDFVLGGDQVGALDDGVGPSAGPSAFLEKPRDPEHHVAMLLSMAGRAHTFHPAVCLVRDDVVLGWAADRVRVHFRAFDEAEARRYVASGEGVGCCGGYESEHRGAQLIAGVEGSLQAILGFPLLLVLPLLRAHCPREAGLLEKSA